jgi:Cu-processing system permease protein
MNGSLGRIDAIARLSARETLRSRSMLIAAILNAIILALLAIAGLTLLNSLPPELSAELGSAQAREGAVRFSLLAAIGLASLMATFVGLFASAGAIGGEIERGTILAVAARPVDRWEILLGKFLGNGLLVVVYLAIQMLVVGAGLAAITGVWVNELFLGVALKALSVLVVVAVAVAISTRLGAVANAIAVTALVFTLAGPGIGILYAIALLSRSELLQQGVEWVRFALPVGPVGDLADIRLAGTLGEAFRTATGEQSVLPIYEWSWIFAIVYIVVALALGAWSFHRRDLR